MNERECCDILVMIWKSIVVVGASSGGVAYLLEVKGRYPYIKYIAASIAGVSLLIWCHLNIILMHAIDWTSLLPPVHDLQSCLLPFSPTNNNNNNVVRINPLRLYHWPDRKTITHDHRGTDK
jgi:hypothetical protein